MARKVRAGQGGSDELLEKQRLLREAYEARGRLLARQQWEFADRLRDETEERDREIVWLRGEVARLEKEGAGKQRELDTLLNTRTFRYTAALRGFWGRIRRSG